MYQHKKNGLNYLQMGNSRSKENLVFVHGSGCNHKCLISLAKELRDYNCYLIDLPDHGKSENRNCTKVEDYVDAVVEFVSSLDNVTIIGHSLGGTICLGVAARSVPSVKRSVIISSAARFDKFDREVHEMVEKQKVNWPYLVRCLGSLYSIEVVKDLFLFDPAEVLLKDFAIDIELNLEPEMGKIKTPTLIMVGKDDFLTIPEYSYKLKKMIKRSKLVVVPRVRHMLPIAKRKEVAYMIRTFVSRTK